MGEWRKAIDNTNAIDDKASSCQRKDFSATADFLAIRIALWLQGYSELIQIILAK